MRGMDCFLTFPPGWLRSPAAGLADNQSEERAGARENACPRGNRLWEIASRAKSKRVSGRDARFIRRRGCLRHYESQAGMPALLRQAEAGTMPQKVTGRLSHPLTNWLTWTYTFLPAGGSPYRAV